MRHRHECRALVVASLLLLTAACKQELPSAQTERPTPVSDAAWRGFLAEAAKADKIDDRIQRCLAYPQLPGVQWLPGAAKARCSLLRKPMMSREEMSALLEKPDGAVALDRRFDDLLHAHFDSPDHRDDIYTAYAPFNDEEPARMLAERWLALAPDSPYAQAAMGSHLLALAWKSRGSKFIRDTPKKDVETMSRLLSQANDWLQRALAAQPRFGPACEKLMNIRMMVGRREELHALESHCTRTDPLSWNMWQQRFTQNDRRWGGTSEETEKTLEAMRPHLAANPALGSLLGRAAARDVSDAELSGASTESMEQQYEQVARIAPDPMFIGDTGVAARQRGDNAKAAAYLSMATTLAPESPRYLSSLAAAREGLGDLPGAVDAARRSIAIRPDSSGFPYAILGRASWHLGRAEDARQSYQAAMQFPEHRPWAFYRWCETYIIAGLQREEALACTAGLVSEFPNDAESWFMRSWVLAELKDPELDQPLARFHELADPRDTRQRQMLSELARIGH